VGWLRQPGATGTIDGRSGKQQGDDQGNDAAAGRRLAFAVILPAGQHGLEQFLFLDVAIEGDGSDVQHHQRDQNVGQQMVQAAQAVAPSLPTRS
jgi:glutamine synthetase